MKGKGIIMPHLIYPTLDLFLYDLREGLGQDDSEIAQKRDHFKRKLPVHLGPQIDLMDNSGNDTVELLGQQRFERFSEAHYEGYFYPVRLSDSYGLVIDGSDKDNQPSENLHWVAGLKQVIEQKLQGEKATLGQTWVFYASVMGVSLDDYDTIAQDCYRALMPNGDWFEDKTGETNIAEGKLFELWDTQQESHVVIILFANESAVSKMVPELLRDELQLFWYRHKITWAYAQSRELKKLLKQETVAVQSCRAEFQQPEELQQSVDLSALLKKANNIFSRYVALLTGLESQRYTIETNLYNYRKRLVKLTQKTGFNFPNLFAQEVEEKYLRQIQSDHASFSTQLKLMENIVASIHAQEMHKNVTHISEVQTKVEWLEMFFVSFYAAEFTHLVIELSHKQSNFWENFSAILVAAIFAGGAAFLGLGLRKHFKFNLHFWMISGIVLAGTLIIAMLLHG